MHLLVLGQGLNNQLFKKIFVSEQAENLNHPHVNVQLVLCHPSFPILIIIMLS